MTRYIFSLRNDTAAAWTAANPVLAEGEPGIENDTRRWKLGDGTTAWADLPYISGDAEQLVGALTAEDVGADPAGTAEALVGPVAAALPGKLDAAELDAEVTALAADPASQLAVLHSATYAPAWSAQHAAQPTLAKMKRADADVTVLLIGDSTANETSEWYYLLAQAFAADWPTHTVKFRQWNDTTATYDAATTIATGTGSRTVTFYNGSVAGWNLVSPLAPNFAALVGDVQPDLCLVSLSHNESDTSTFARIAMFRSRYLALTESITAACPNTDMILIGQNPALADDSQAGRTQLVNEVAAMRGFGFIDVHQHWVDAGKPAAWYVDNVHPSATGSQEWADVVHASIQYHPDAEPRTRQPSSFATPGDQLIKNGDFASLDAVTFAPTNWSVTGATFSKDTTNYESPNGYALRIQSAGASPAYIVQTTLPARLLRGQWLTVAARVRLPAGYASSHGRVAIYDGTLTQSKDEVSSRGAGGFRWILVSARISPTATTVRAYIYADTGSTGTGDVVVDRIVATRGPIPRDLPFML